MNNAFYCDFRVDIDEHISKNENTVYLTYLVFYGNTDHVTYPVCVGYKNVGVSLEHAYKVVHSHCPDCSVRKTIELRCSKKSVYTAIVYSAIDNDGVLFERVVPIGDSRMMGRIAYAQHQALKDAYEYDEVYDNE